MSRDLCSIDGCVRAVLARGWCSMHYERWRTGRPVGDARSLYDLDYRLEVGRSKSDATGCWPWLGATNANGYGMIRVNGRLHQAHRAYYAVEIGLIPEGFHLDHDCHNWAVAAGECSGGDLCPHRRCCNPEHLVPRLAHENQLLGLRNQNTLKTHCVNGHEFTVENTLLHKSTERDGLGKTYRNCRACCNGRKHAARARANA